MLIDPTLHLLEYLEALPPTNSEPWPDDHPKVPSRIPFRQRNPLTSLSFNLWKCRYWPDWWTLHFLVCICVRLQGFTKVSNILSVACGFVIVVNCGGKRKSFSHYLNAERKHEAECHFPKSLTMILWLRHSNFMTNHDRDNQCYVMLIN